VEQRFRWSACKRFCSVRVHFLSPSFQVLVSMSLLMGDYGSDSEKEENEVEPGAGNEDQGIVLPELGDDESKGIVLPDLVKSEKKKKEKKEKKEKKKKSKKTDEPAATPTPTPEPVKKSLLPSAADVLNKNALPSFLQKSVAEAEAQEKEAIRETELPTSTNPENVFFIHQKREREEKDVPTSKNSAPVPVSKRSKAGPAAMPPGMSANGQPLDKAKKTYVKDKEKSKRALGQSSHSRWKTEGEMLLRQQFD